MNELIKEAEDKNGEKKDGGDGAVMTVVLRAGLHCEGCAHKVKRSLIKHLDGVERVKANYESKKVTVVGQVDPAKVKERVEEKTKKPAHLLSPKPKPANKVNHTDGQRQNPGENPVHIKSLIHQNMHNNIKPDQINAKEVEVAGATFVLKTRVHCDNCVHKINKIIKKYEGVEDVKVDLEKDKITIKGKMDMKEMLPYLNTKLKRVVEIAPNKDSGGNSKSKEDGGRGKKDEEQSKVDSGGGGGEEKIEKEEEENPKNARIKGGGEEPKTESSGVSDESSRRPPEENTTSRIEVVNKLEYNGYEYGAHAYHPQQVQGKGYVVEYWNAPDYTDVPPPFYFHVPQMFSDENPNACSVM